MLGAPLRISCRVASSRSHGRILVASFPHGNPLVTASVAAHSSHPIIGRRFWSDRESFASQVHIARVATQLGVFRLRHRPLLIVDRRPSTSTPPRTQAGNRLRSTVQAIRLYITLFSEYHTEAISLRFLLLTLSSFVALFTAKLALPRRSSDTQRCHSPIPTGGESISSVPTRSSVLLLHVGFWLAWSGFAPFRHLPRPSPRWSMPRAPWFFSCGRATAPPIIRSPVHLPQHLRPAPEAHSRPSSSISRSRSCTYCHAFLCSRHSVSGEPRVVQPFILLAILRKARRIRTPSGPAVHLHSLSAARRAYLDREWSSRSSSVTIRCQEGVSGSRVVHPFIFSRYPPPGRRIRTPSGPGVHLHSLSAARKAYPDPGWSSRFSSPAVRCQEGVSRPRAVQAFILTRYPLPGRRIWTASGPGVHLHSLPAARKASPDPGRSSRSSSVTIPLPGRRLRIPGGPAVHLTRYLPPGRRIRTPSGPAVHLYLLSASRKAFPDRDWSRRSSSLAIRLQEGESGSKVVQAFILTRYPPPGRRIGTPSGPAVHLHSLSAARKAYPDPEWSSRSSSLAIRCQEGVSGPRVVQAFIFTRYPPPGRRIRTPSGPGVHPHSLSASRKAYRDPEWSSRSSSLTVRHREGVSRPRMVLPFIFTRYPPPGRRTQTPMV